MSKIRVLNSKNGYNLLAEYYHKKEKYWDSFEKGKVLPLLGDVGGKKILDIGAGAGRLALRLAQAGAGVVALDVSEEMLNNLKFKIKNLKLNIVAGDAENLPFENESFDIVIAVFLIVHLKNLEKFFGEVYRVLKSAPKNSVSGQGGIFLVTNINQRKAPAIKTAHGLVKIESYYHQPEKVRGLLEELAFGIEREEFVKEGEVWVNQIVLAKK